MATVRNPLLEDEERRPPGMPSVPAGAGAAPMGNEGAVQAAPGPGRGTGFINPQTILGLNRGAGAALAENVAGGLDTQAEGVRGALRDLSSQQYGPGGAGQYGALQRQAGDIEARGRMAPTFSGVGTLIGQEAGRQGPYSSGMQSFDAFLAQAAGGDRLQRAGMGTQGLGREVAQAQTAAENRPQPGPSSGPTPEEGEDDFFTGPGGMRRIKRRSLFDAAFNRGGGRY